MVLIKTDDRHIISRLLDDLCRRFFPSHINEEDQTVLPLRCLWIQGFDVYPYKNSNRVLDPECLQSFNSGENGDDEEMYQTKFLNLENLSAMDLHLMTLQSLLPALSKLKFFCGIVNDQVVKSNNLMYFKKNHLFLFLRRVTSLAKFIPTWNTWESNIIR